MDLQLRISLILGTSFYSIIIFLLLQKRKVNLNYSLLWIFSATCMFIAALFPHLVMSIANLLGVATPSNMVFILGGMLVLFILISITAIVSKITNTFYKLAQSLAILEKRVRELENKSSN